MYRDCAQPGEAMKLEKVFGLSSVLCLAAMPLAGQETNQVEQLRKQLQQLKENYEKSQQQQREQIEALQKQIEALRQSQQHPHTWAFVDQPLVLNRAFGPDGLRNIGGQLSWLLPTPFYTEAFLGVFNGSGGAAFSFRNPDGNHGRTPVDRDLRGPGDLLYVPRIASSFDLTDQQTLVVGTSAGFGPNDTGPHSRTEIYGADVYWKWKSPKAMAGFPFVSVQAEALYERFGAGEDVTAALPLPAENLRDWGFYSQVLWGIKPRWVAGLRGEFVTGNDGAFDASDVFRGDRTRISPNMTWYPSEFSKIRLQYNYDHGQLFGDQHSVWML